MEKKEPYVSVVVPTLNRSAKLSRLLDSLFLQTYPKERFEIIVGNGSSKDNTKEMLAEYEKKAPCKFIWFTQEDSGISYARNLCISKSDAEIICFTDDDCIAEKNWIVSIVGGFTDDSIGAIGGKVVSYKIQTPIQEYVEKSNILSQKEFMIKNKLITSNAAYRRQILKDIQGFDNFLVACEDVDICIKTQLLGFKLLYVPNAIIYHDHVENVKGLFYRSYRNGKGLVQLHKKYCKKYNLAFYVSNSCYRIMAILVRYPITLISAFFLKKDKYFIMEPLFEIIRTGGLTGGIIYETSWGKEYTGDQIRSSVDFIEFMENKSIFSLLPKIKQKIIR